VGGGSAERSSAGMVVGSFFLKLVFLYTDNVEEEGDSRLVAGSHAGRCAGGCEWRGAGIGIRWFPGFETKKREKKIQREI